MEPNGKKKKNKGQESELARQGQESQVVQEGKTQSWGKEEEMPEDDPKTRRGGGRGIQFVSGSSARRVP